MGFNEKPFRRRKYGNVPTTGVFSGRAVIFKSKLEYRYAQYLDFLKTAGEIQDWNYEGRTFRFSNRTKAPYEYTPDFVVKTKNGKLEYHETKGMVARYDLEKFRLLWEQDIKLIVIFAQKPKLSVQKIKKLERYCIRVIWNARTLWENIPMDMT